MDPASSSEPKQSYSWRRDSHIVPKNSRWLQENLTDMDNKIKSMIKVIEEDADSFARRAEMYYKKRPELMKLVEEFYRAYRALAERYDRVTGALRQAHRTIAEAFPNQIQLVLPDEPPSELPDSGEEEKVTFAMPSHSDGNMESHEKNDLFLSKEGWKHFTCLLADEEAAQTEFAENFLNKSLNLKEDTGKDSELIKLQDEVSKLSEENKSLKNQITSESTRADKAETESQSFKDAVSKLNSEVESAFLQYQVSQKRVSYLEAEISQNREEARNLNDEMSIKLSKVNIAEQRCLDLEIENRSLRLELEKFNEAMSRRFEEVADLFKENQSLHNTVKSESMRADQAEAETFRLRDAISKLKSEMETALFQYKISQEKVSDLEAEISRAEDQFQKFNKELYIRSSKLNSSEEQCLLLLEENKSLQFTLDKFKLRNSTQEEELAAKEKELDKLIQSLVDERQRRMASEMAHESMKKLYSQSEEKVRLLGLEIQSGTESLRRMEEEIKRLCDENSDLKEKRFSSVSKIVGLQDEIGSFRKSKRKAEDELKFHVDENKVLRQELSSLKNERNDSEDRHLELTAQIGEVNFNVVSLRAFVKDLLEGKKELKDACKKREDEEAFNLKNSRFMESISEKNFFLENSLSDVTAELELLREKIKGLEKFCESLHNNSLSHESENSMLVSHVDAVTRNIKNLSQKNTLIEESFADINVEFDGLRGKVKTLEESCQSLYYQNCHHIQSLENHLSTLEGKHVKEKNLALHQLEELKDMFRSEKEEHENHIFLFRSQTSALNNQMHLLKEENHLKSKKLEEEEHKTAKSDIECFIMHKALYDITEKNIILSDECQRCMEKLRCAEKLTLELRQAQSTHNKKLASLLDHNKKLLEWLHVMGKEDGETSNVVNEDMNSQNLVSHNKNHELMEVYKHPKGINDRNRQKEELNVEVETMHGDLSDIHGPRCTFLGEIPKPFAEAKFREHLSCVFRSSKSSEVDQLIGDIQHLHGITDGLSQNIGEINENMRVLQSDNMHLRDLVVNLETRNPVVLKDIDRSCKLKPQIEAGKNQLEQIDMERFKKAELLVNLEDLVTELNKANVVKEGLEKNILSLSKDIVCKNDEIEILHQSNDKLVEEYSKLHNEAEAMRSGEKNLESELRRAKDEGRRCEEESAAYLIEIHAALVSELILRQTIPELMQKFDSLERENKELKAGLSAYVPHAASLDNDILSSKTKQGNLKNLSQVRAKDHSSKVSAGILELKRLHAKVKVLQKAVTDAEKLLIQEEIVVDTNADSETKNSTRSKGQLGIIKKKDIISDMRKSNAAGKDFNLLLRDDKEVSKIKHGQMMKDIQLDHVLSSSRHGGDSSAETDEQSHEACQPASENDMEYHQIEILEEERSDKPSSEVVLVKELSVDKIELPVNDTESHQEWCRRVSEALSSDAQRLSILHKNLEKLKKSIRVSEMSNQPSISQFKSVSEQLKESEGVIMQLIDINFTLAKIADSFSASQGGNEGRRQIWERVRKASEKIGGAEVNLQNTQRILSKLLEEEESKKAKALEGKSRIPLKDLICSKRNNVRQKKRRLCGCIRLKTKGD